MRRTVTDMDKVAHNCRVIFTGYSDLPIYSPSMSIAEADRDPEKRASLRSAVGAELAREGNLPRFPAILQARYEADRAVLRSRELRKLSIFGAIVYFVTVLLFHIFVMAHPNLLAFLTELIGIPPVIFLVVRRCSGPEVSAFRREATVLALCCLVVLGYMLDIATAPTDIVVMNMFLIVSPVVACMFFTRMAPIPGLIFVGFVTVNLTIAILARTDIPADVRFYPLGCELSAAFFALFALRELDSALRRNYLHGLEQTLRIEDLGAENRSLDLLSATDALTGAGNRRQFEKELDELRPSRSAAHFLLLVDIDYFKQINDRFGHPVGDACLREAVVVMKALLRPSDTIARVGGDEFAILLSDCMVLDARRTADRVCVGIADHRFEVDGRAHQLSVTVGGAEWDPGHDVAQFFARADSALYQAKHAGRDRVAWATPQEVGRASSPPGPDGAGTFAA
jgi:diguanylate cyclase (GGDEF)-like protein